MYRNAMKAALVLSATLSASAFAADFTRADALFNQRAQGNRLVNIASARSAYAAQLQSATQVSDRVYAVEKMGALDYYEGFIQPNTSIKVQRFADCMDRVEKYVPNTMVQYYYWKGACLASWANARGILTSLARSQELVNLLTRGAQIDPTYEGGGSYRILAAAYARLPAINPFGPTGNATKALDFANRAISSPAYAGADDPSTATGNYFYNVYIYKAEALVSLGRKSEAITVLKGAIARIDNGDLPVGREPETKELRSELAESLAKIQ